MQAYHHHQQFPNLNLPNGASNLLIGSPSQMTTMHHLHNQQHQNNYQDLVRAYLPQLNGMANLTNTSSGSPSPSSSASSSSLSSVASFAARLMSLNEHELKYLNSDNELMRHIHEARLLIENKLHDINSKSGDDARQNKLQSINLAFQQQQHREQQQLQQLQHQQQQHLLVSQENYYQSYYAQQLALNQMLLMDSSRYNKPNTFGNLQSIDNCQQLNLTPTSLVTSPEVNGLASAQPPAGAGAAPALDLRTTSALSSTPSPASLSRSGSTGSAANASSRQHHKKIKLTEYKMMQQRAEQGSLSGLSTTMQQSNSRQYHDISNTANPTATVSNESNENYPLEIDIKPGNKRTHSTDHYSLTASNNTRSRQQEQLNQKQVSAASGMIKKYKGEFDEPTPEEVTERERQLSRPDHYHSQASKTGNCSCVIGSVFVNGKSSQDALVQLEKWRSLDIEERIKHKWDLDDLPKDIPLCDIKKYEDLRRDYSKGMADFGGASKRKPLSIRGTRQFLLMLYCLWGHSSRNDLMQRDGYCPHCFAKIRTQNEQSTLVRVVNHFNMKHKRGANPRLSPHIDGNRSSSPNQILETLDRVVEIAVATTEQQQHEVKQEPEPQASQAALKSLNG